MRAVTGREPATLRTVGLSLIARPSAGSIRGGAEHAENRAGKQQLQGSRKAPRAVPTEAVVKELPSARTQEGDDVLEVRGGTRSRAKRCRIERASPRGKKKEARKTAADLEATRADVLVRQAIAREVDEWP